MINFAQFLLQLIGTRNRDFAYVLELVGTRNRDFSWIIQVIRTIPSSVF